MEKYRAIPQGFMTVGELAKKMNTTVRTLQYLGFTLDDIKNRLVTLNTPENVVDALSEQAKVIAEKIATLSEALQAIEKLRVEILQMQMKNEYYWMIKHLDNKTIDTLSTRFDVGSATTMTESIIRLKGYKHDKGKQHCKTFRGADCFNRCVVYSA